MKAFIAAIALVLATARVFAVDINIANRAQLEQLRGIGPPQADRILVEREKGRFKDWPDLIARVRGIREAKARQLSQAGLTVGGVIYDPTPP
ncbi:MAG: helix-hairpin-helix domain-containing protein [Aquincola sp.]|nr:helix-hairpin-helix domain-containing protein [Aquincola sp.]MDH4290771.1 helix-hairpin-helix domain-containing protein [Aquincola sp.]